MREKIELFSKGIFSFDKPELKVSIDSVVIHVEAGKTAHGSFCVSASDHNSFKGLVVSPCDNISFENTSFTGAENTVNYSFKATYLDPGDQIRTRITIICEYGEVVIPFIARIDTPACDTETEKISDLFHFANLAQYNWAEAKSIFKSEEFERMLAHYERDSVQLYRTLRDSGNDSLALEEFLIAEHKKKFVSITCTPAKIVVDNVDSDVTGSLILNKDTWGYTQLSLESEGEFFVPDRKIIWSDDFENNQIKIGYTIKYESLHAGVNSCALVISYPGRKCRVPIKVTRAGNEGKNREGRNIRKHLMIKIYEDYLRYRFGMITRQGFIGEEETNLMNLKAIKEETVVERLAEIYLLILSGKLPKADAALSVIEEDEDWEGYPLIVYALALYLRANLSNSEREPVLLMDRIRDLYEHEKDPFIYLLYMKLDKRKRLSNHSRYEALRSLEEGKCPSSIVLLEAVRIVNEEPALLKGFSQFDLYVLNYGLKNHILERQTAVQAGYLAGKEKQTTPLMLKTLELAFDQFKINEVLEPYTAHLIAYRNAHEVKGNYDPKAYELFNIAVIEQIRVRDLYEHCLMAAGDGFAEPLPKELVSYLGTGTDLSDDTRTAFYANTLFYKKGTEEISKQLESEMKQFAIRKFMEGEISPGLEVIYNSMLTPEDFDEKLLNKLPEFAFKFRITVSNSAAVAVLIAHPELSTVKRYPLNKGIAYADIYTRAGTIVPIDESGNCITSCRKVSEHVLENKSLITLACEKCRDDKGVQLHLHDAIEEEGVHNDNVDALRRLVLCEDLNPVFVDRCRLELIDYYYDNYEGEVMESHLIKLKLSNLTCRERAHVISLMVTRDLFSLAMKNMELYGFNKVEDKKLARLADTLIESKDEGINSDTFIKLCYHVLDKRKQTPKIVMHLAKKLYSDTAAMYDVWTEAVHLGCDATDIEERILETVLFTQSDVSFAKDVFKHYYSHAATDLLIRAFISYYAYDYLAFDRDPEDETIELMRKETDSSENEVCTLAILKYYSTRTKHTDSERQFIEEKLDMLERKGIIFPFFKDFGGNIKTPRCMEDKYYIEYHTEPGKTVRIHYLYISSRGSETFIEEDMQDLGYGIFVKPLTIFYGEIVQYYISEEDESGGRITEASQISIEPDALDNDESNYGKLNLIITAREMGDTKTMQKLMESYIKTEYLCRHIFKPLE